MAMKSLKVHTRHEGRKEEGRMVLGETREVFARRSRPTSAFDRRATRVVFVPRDPDTFNSGEVVKRTYTHGRNFAP